MTSVSPRPRSQHANLGQRDIGTNKKTGKCVANVSYFCGEKTKGPSASVGSACSQIGSMRCCIVTDPNRRSLSTLLSKGIKT